MGAPAELGASQTGCPTFTAHFAVKVGLPAGNFTGHTIPP